MNYDIAKDYINPNDRAEIYNDVSQIWEMFFLVNNRIKM